MAAVKPFWQTDSGLLGTFVQGTNVEIQLTSSNTSLLELITGELPPGLKLDGENQIIYGVPLDKGIDLTYDFVLRASNNTGPNNSKVIQDRSFKININSNVVPEILTPEGLLRVGNKNDSYVLNNSTINYQFTYSTTSVPPDQKLIFYIDPDSGELPPGIKLTEDGLLYGTIRDDLNLDSKLIQGSYDKDYYDINPFDYGDNIVSGTGTTNISSGRVTTAQVTYGGNGYLFDPEVIVGGSIGSITVTNGGSGYTTPPKVVFGISPVSGGITATGIANISNGVVTSISITNPGTGYDTPPRIYFQDQNTGSGATATCVLKQGSGSTIIARTFNGSIVELDVENSGSGYLEPPLISFGLPTAGSRIISKTYKFKVTLSNGVNTDTKLYSIIVKSEDSLRADTTFIFSDTNDFDASRTFVQPPIWISSSILPEIKGNNNYAFDLEVFDPTPTVGNIYFSLLDLNFDGTESQIGPLDIVKNQNKYQISSIDLSLPAKIVLSESRIFKTGDRVKITHIIGTTELNDNIFYLNPIDDFTYELYSDKTLINGINATLYSPYSLGGYVQFNESYLSLDLNGGEISGFIPYQPEITRNYIFTVKASRVLEGKEVASEFKQFQLTVKGNINNDIEFITPTLIGHLGPNEQSLFQLEAQSTLDTADVYYQLIPGYGTSSGAHYIELNVSELDGNIFIEGYGLNPYLSLDKGQTYKINVELTNFTLSFRNVDGTYFNSSSIRHSTGQVGNASQEKQDGYYLVNVPYSNTASDIILNYKNIKNDGLILKLYRYRAESNSWIDYNLDSFYFNEYDALSNNIDKLLNEDDIISVFLDYTKVEFTLKKYNKNTLIWETVNYPITKPTAPLDGDYWLDFENSNVGLLEFRYIGIAGEWVPVNPDLVNEFPNNSEGDNADYKIINESGTYKVLRKINTFWKYLEKLPFDLKGAYDPNVFMVPYDKPEPETNLTTDVWFKYRSLFNGRDKSINIKLKNLESIPSDLSLSLTGEIIGKIPSFTGYTYRSYYTGNTLYIENDIVTVDEVLFKCVNQYRSSGNWFLDLNNWETFTYDRRTVTSFDVNQYGSGRFSIAGLRRDDNTTIDSLIRFRVRAKDTQNVYYVDKDFNINYKISINVTLTNIYLKPLLSKNDRADYFNFITDTSIFLTDHIYRPDDPEFGVQRVPKMLLLGGLETSTAERYATAVKRNYYDRPLYFGEVKTAVATQNGEVKYEVVYVEIVDPNEIGSISVADRIKLDFTYDDLTTDYTKIRMDDNSILVTQTGLDTVYPSSISLMQEELKKVSLEKQDSVILDPNYDDFGRIPEFQLDGPNQGQYIDIDPLNLSLSDDFGFINERVAIIEDFLLTIQPLIFDSNFQPLWMNSSQDGTGNPVGFVKAIPLCYTLPGKSQKILELIKKDQFDFTKLNFKIDRILIETPLGETGDKYIKFINREII